MFKNIDDFQVTLSDLNFEVDILILTECRLDPNKPIPFIANYNSSATIYNNNQSDGVVIYVKKNLKVNLKEIKLDHTSCMQVETINNIVLGIYRSPSNKNASQFANSFNTHLDIVKSHKNIVLLGDININLIPRSNEPAHECNNRFHYLNMLATHGILPGHTLPTRQNTCLDHCMLKIDKRKTSAFIAVLNTTVTDHCAVFLCLSNLTQKENQCTKVMYNLDKAIENLIHTNLDNLLYSDDPNFIAKHLIMKLSESLEESRSVGGMSNKRKKMY